MSSGITSNILLLFLTLFLYGDAGGFVALVGCLLDLHGLLLFSVSFFISIGVFSGSTFFAQQNFLTAKQAPARATIPPTPAAIKITIFGPPTSPGDAFFPEGHLKETIS